MSNTPSEGPNPLFADLKTLRRQLEEVSARTKGCSESSERQPREIGPPVLIIRGHCCPVKLSES
jgi:hypothetical protein